MRVAPAPLSGVVYLLLGGYALFGRMQAIQALALSWLFTMISQGIAPESSLASIGRYVVLAGAGLSVALRSGQGFTSASALVNRTVLVTVLLGGAIVLHSLLTSPLPDVSILKAISWTITTVTLLSAWAGLTLDARQNLEKQLFYGLIVLMLVSLPLLKMSLGYLRNGHGFQGVLNHPQAFGPTMGLLGAWAGSRMLAERKPSWWMVMLFGGCLALIVLSEARTAGFAVVLGIGIAGLTGSVLSQRRLKDFLPGLRSPRLYLVIGFAALVVLASGSVLSDRVNEYVSKRGDSSNILEAYDQSRGRLIDQMLENIRLHPVPGIGFGIASDPASMEVDRDPILGLPTGAAIEKGVLPLAVLEELGVFGFFFVAFWVLILVRRAARGGGMTAVSVCFTALLMNMGESMLFSPGGMGLLLMIMITWAATDWQRVSE